MAGSDDTSAITTLSSRIVYQNRWLRVREDILRYADGRDGLYGVVERGEFVVLAPLGADAAAQPSITLVQQYRYPVRQRLWELPMGMWEDRPGAQMEEIARGELREETGLVAAELEYVGCLFQGAGYSNQRGHVYVARGLVQKDTQREPTEQDMICRTFPLHVAEDMVRNGDITCMVTLATFGLLKVKGII